MNEIIIPTVEFKNQVTSSVWPNELYEAIVVTPELSFWAKTFALPIVTTQFNEAKGFERLALQCSTGEGSWRKNGGPAKSIKADNLGQVVRFLEMLSAGRHANSWDGWIDRAEWKRIVEVVSQ